MNDGNIYEKKGLIVSCQQIPEGNFFHSGISLTVKTPKYAIKKSVFVPAPFVIEFSDNLLGTSITFPGDFPEYARLITVEEAENKAPAKIMTAVIHRPVGPIKAAS